jgi:hypothetical protein
MNMGFANSANTVTAAIPTVPLGMPVNTLPTTPGAIHSTDQFKNTANSTAAEDADKKQRRFMTGLAIGGTVLAGLILLLATRGKSKTAVEKTGLTSPRKSSYWKDDFASDLVDIAVFDAGAFAVEGLLEGLLGCLF